MLSRLASYLMGGAEAAAETVDDGAENNKENEPEHALESRLSQVDVENDEWILIDPNVEGCTSMDESWYVTPPACFTQPGPVHVETSPLEDLLIEHPSMSVYRSAGRLTTMEKKKKQQQPDSAKKQRNSKQRRPVPPKKDDNDAGHDDDSTMPPSDVVIVNNHRKEVRSLTTSASSNANSSRQQHHNHHHHPHHHNHQGTTATAANAAAVVPAEQVPRRASIRDLRNTRGDDNVRIVQIRSAQKLLEKRASQTAKRNLLDRGNKTREVASSGKSRRPRRQDRLRLNNSNANNNRKC